MLVLCYLHTLHCCYGNTSEVMLQNCIVILLFPQKQEKAHFANIYDNSTLSLCYLHTLHCCYGNTSAVIQLHNCVVIVLFLWKQENAHFSKIFLHLMQAGTYSYILCRLVHIIYINFWGGSPNRTNSITFLCVLLHKLQ